MDISNLKTLLSLDNRDMAIVIGLYLSRFNQQALDAFEDELYSSNPSWNKLSTMIDVDSFAKYYLINEFAQNTDSYFPANAFPKPSSKRLLERTMIGLWPK